jgi:hypothetical protein
MFAAPLSQVARLTDALRAHVEATQGPAAAAEPPANPPPTQHPPRRAAGAATRRRCASGRGG